MYILSLTMPHTVIYLLDSISVSILLTIILLVYVQLSGTSGYNGVCVQIFVGRKFRDFNESAWVRKNKNAKISPYLGLSRVHATTIKDYFKTVDIFVKDLSPMSEFSSCRC